MAEAEANDGTGGETSAGKSPVASSADIAETVAMSAASRIGYRMLRSLAIVIAKGLLRLSVVGIENIPASGGYVLAPGGHRSILDTPLAAIAGSRVLRFMGAETYFKIPGLGIFLRAMGGFPVERSLTDRAALRISEEVLRNGEPLVVFPEGTRQEGPVVQPLKEGAVFLATRAGVPIVPIGIGGAERAMPKGARFIKPTKVTIVIGEPIYPPTAVDGGRVKRSEVKRLSNELRETLQELFDDAQIRAGA